jgi:hypothetical protein
MCTVLLPPGVNPIAVNKYININNTPGLTHLKIGAVLYVYFAGVTKKGILLFIEKRIFVKFWSAFLGNWREILMTVHSVGLHDV